ncbi:hypothetical protein C7M84_002031 [Penaeus vannamei]|uniref:Uncharacterized protein n=1 Tax=Penaeus vannamei TaxID=6689 RepID=A0A3R7MKM6_PENVA|nr:hypothetical protein C7M84_002031 [Penaeus vannamei]
MSVRAEAPGGDRPPAAPAAPQPAPIIVDAQLVPGPRPCLPITKQFTQYETVDNYVPIYSTSVSPIYFPTTIYDTKYVTLTNYVTKLLQTTVYAVHTEYETSVSQGLIYESVTLPLSNPEYETRTNIQLAVVPSLVTEIVAVTRPSSQVIPVVKTQTRTLVLVPEYTTTEVVPYPIVTTNTIVETVRVPITTTVTVTAAPLPVPKKPVGPKVTKTLVQTNVHYTPAYVTNTEYVTRYTTVTERQSAGTTSGGEVRRRSCDAVPIFLPFASGCSIRPAERRSGNARWSNTRNAHSHT